jgi:hypothetical protein
MRSIPLPPNILRWVANMKKLHYWDHTNEAFYTHFVSACKDKPFEQL